MVQLVFKSTFNIIKLKELLIKLMNYDPNVALVTARSVAHGSPWTINVDSAKDASKLINSMIPAGVMQWHFVNSKTGDIFGGTSGKKEVKEEKPVKENFALTIYAVCGEWDRLKNALGSALKLDKDEASALVTTIEKEVKRNGLWHSTWASIDISAWTAANLKDEWSIYDDNTGNLISSPKRKKKPCKSEKFSNKGHELINTVVNSMQDLTHYYEKLEVENAKLCNQVETLLKVRDELITKLDVLSDKFIKLKSILD